MSSERVLSICMESVVEDVMKQQGTTLNDFDLASRRAAEEASRRNEAAAWLRRTVGVVGAKDLAEEPSEEEFRFGLRNGIILCNAINKVLPGAIPKVVEVSADSFVVLDGAPLSAYQYFENVRNFLVTLQGMGLPTFEASDLEKMRIGQTTTPRPDPWRISPGAKFVYPSEMGRSLGFQALAISYLSKLPKGSRRLCIDPLELLEYGALNVEVNKPWVKNRLGEGDNSSRIMEAANEEEDGLVEQVRLPFLSEEECPVPSALRPGEKRWTPHEQRDMAWSGGKGSRVVDSVLALKYYIERSQVGKNGSSKFGGIARPGNSAKHFTRKSSDPFMNFISRTQSLPEKPPDDLSFEDSPSGDFLIQSTKMKSSQSLNMLVRTALSNKKLEEVPLLVETMLTKVLEEFERHFANQNEMAKSTFNDMSAGNKSAYSAENLSIHTEEKMEEQDNAFKIIEEESTLKEKDENELQESRLKQQQKEAEVRESNERFMPVQQQLTLEKNSFQGKLSQTQLKRDVIVEDDLRGMQENMLKDLEEIKQKALKERLIKQQLIFNRQQTEIQTLKSTLQLTKTAMEYMKSQYLEEFDNLGNLLIYPYATGNQLHAVASTASGYHKVLEENKKLYNQIQDLKGSIRVYCRVRPFLPGQRSNIGILSRMDDQHITIFSPLKTGKDTRRIFTFNKVFGPSASQEEVFSDTRPLIRSVLDGYNVCIFAYGQTGSGKTYTMVEILYFLLSGPKEVNEKTIGVNYRALNDLFYLSDQRKDTFCYEISVQMLEIYNEQVRDLLNEGLNRRYPSLVLLKSTEDVIEVMNLGFKNRAVSCTAINDHSSRSHSCLTVHVQGKELTSGNAVRGCMHLVDLAGSERVDKSELLIATAHQIAALKMELAKRGSEEPLRPTMFIPDLSRMKQNSASVVFLNDEAELSYPTSSRQPMEEVGNIQVVPELCLRTASSNFGQASADQQRALLREEYRSISCG
ncbi:Kinesin-4 [Platanthera guangdongensis]|uniref:Kinesin-4 n=1 Tax=Platanthera guangdongensis TaxID=2320717 RepID=A0ABR2MUB7_9ASPA